MNNIAEITAQIPTEEIQKVMKAIEDAGIIKKFSMMTTLVPNPPTDRMWREVIVSILLEEMTRELRFKKAFMELAVSLTASIIAHQPEFDQERFTFATKEMDNEVSLLLEKLFGKRR